MPSSWPTGFDAQGGSTPYQPTATMNHRTPTAEGVFALRSREDLELALWALSVGGYTVYPSVSDSGELACWVWLSNVDDVCDHWYYRPDGSDLPPIDGVLRERLRSERAAGLAEAATRSRQAERAQGVAGPCKHAFDKLLEQHPRLFDSL